MASRSWDDLYASDGNSSIAEGVYDVEVTDARTNVNARQVWIDLKVLNGPSAGKTTSVSIYLPNPEADKFRGQLFNFKKRLAGFDRSALKAMDPEAPLETQLSILADALIGQKTSATIELRADGEYAGTNQLASTKPLDGAPVAVAAPIAQVAPVAQAAPVAVTEDTAAAASVALDGEAPF
jgi:hypothetical protein